MGDNMNLEHVGGNAPEIFPDFTHELAVYTFPNENGYRDFYTHANQNYRDDHNALFRCLGDDYCHHVYQGPRRQRGGVSMADQVRNTLSQSLTRITEAAEDVRTADEEEVFQIIAERGDAIREANPNGLAQAFDNDKIGNARFYAFMMANDTDPMFGTGVELSLYCRLFDRIVEVWHEDTVLVHANGELRSNFGQIPIRDVIMETNGNHGYRLLRHRWDRN